MMRRPLWPVSLPNINRSRRPFGAGHADRAKETLGIRVHVIVETANLLDVERSGHAALAWLQDADGIDRRTVGVSKMRIRLWLMRSRILVHESDLLSDVDSHFLQIQGATREDGDDRSTGVATG